MSTTFSLGARVEARVADRVHVWRPSARAALTFVAFVGYLAAGWLIVLTDHSIIGDAWSRVGNAYYVLFSRDPHLAAVGFVWNPLPSLALLPLLPFKAIWPALVATGFAATIVSAACTAGALWQLDGMAADWRVPRLPRIAILVLFAGNPMIVYYAANGMSEAMFVFTLLLTARYLARWAAGGGVAPLVVAGVGLAVAYLARYEAAAAAGGGVVAVIFVDVLRARGAAVTNRPAPRSPGYAPRSASVPLGLRGRLAALKTGAARQIAVFAVIGVLSTAAYVLLYAALRTAYSAAFSNAAALLVTAVGNTAANRRFTFGIRGRGSLARDHAAGLAALGVALAITSAALGLLAAFAPHAPRWLEVAVLVFANAAATVVRFLLLRLVVTKRRGAVPRAGSDAPAVRMLETVAADLAVFLAPFVLTFVGWAAASWIIVGDPFQQFTSVYGVASQLTVAQSGIASVTGQGTSSAYLWITRQIVALEPGFALLALLAGLLALRGGRGRALVLPVGGVLGAVVAFSVFGFMTGRTLGWLRYFIVIIPLAAAFALAIAAPRGDAGERPRRPRGLVRLAGAVPALVAVAAVAVSVPSGAFAVLDPGLNPPYGGEAFQLRPVVLGFKPDVIEPNGQYDVGRAAATYVDALDLPRSSVLVDAAMGFPIVLQSARPSQFIITSDRDFQQALGDPAAFGVRYLLVPEDVGYQSLDAINRAYPGIYEHGAPFVRLTRSFSAGGNSWRLYEVVGE